MRYLCKYMKRLSHEAEDETDIGEKTKIIQMRNLDFKASNRFVHDNFYWNYRISGLQAALAFSQIDYSANFL